MVAKVEICQAQDGRQFIMVTDEFGLPTCFHLNTYLVSQLSEKALNTQIIYAGQLAFVFRHFEAAGIDLPERIQSGELLTRAEYGAFERACRFKAKSEQAKHDPANKVVKMAQWSSKQLDRYLHASTAAEEYVGSAATKGRLRRFLGYLRWLYNLYHGDCSPPQDLIHRFVQFEHWVNEDARKLRDQNHVTKDPYLSVIPDDVFVRLLGCIAPEASDNPFKGSRRRNSLMIWIFNDTGMRKGALAKLKLADVVEDWETPRLRINRTPNDPDDPRKRRPSQKTNAGTVPISHELMAALRYYRDHIRAHYPAAQQHDFLFVSEKGKTKGQPLTIRGIDYLFAVLSESLGFHVTAHILRHKWNDLFSEKGKALGIDPAVLEDVRKVAMTWSENSTMGSVYNKKHLAALAKKISAARQDRQFQSEQDDE